MQNFEFNNKKKNYVSYLDYDSYFSQERDVVINDVQGRAGGVLDRIDIKPRVLEVELLVDNWEVDLTREEIIDDLNAWLMTDEPVPIKFAREPNKIYYGLLTEQITGDDFVGFSKLTVKFICPDPYKYSNARYKQTAISDQAVIYNKGTAETYPVIQARALKNSTSFLIAKNDEDYFMIGESEDAFKESQDKDPRLYNTGFENLLGWNYLAQGTIIQASDASGVSSGAIQGVSGSSRKQYAVTVKDYGQRADKGWHGPVLKRSLPRAVDNFKARVELKIFSRRQGVGKGYMYLFDDQGNVFAAIGLLDAKNTKTYVRAHFILFNEYGDRWEWYDNAGNWAYDNAWVNLEIVRDDYKWRIKTWHYYDNPKTGKRELTSRMTKTFNDRARKYTQKLAQVGFSAMKHNSYDVLPVYFNTMYVNELLPDSDSIPILIKQGDEIYIDMADNLVLLNNEPVSDQKDFGSDFFSVDKGVSELFVVPENTFDTEIYWQDRFL